MKRKVLLIIGIVAILAVAFYFTRDNNKVCFEDECFNVEVVSTAAEREKGLMFRESLDMNKGMLFVFDSEGNYPFWMKNTLIPLDIIWMDSSGKIVDIKEAVPCESDPCLIYYHTGSAKYAMEISRGLSSELGIEIGQIAESKFIA